MGDEREEGHRAAEIFAINWEIYLFHCNLSPLEANKNWDWEIRADSTNWNLDLGNLFQYRHLLFSLVRRDFLLSYQQTVLGPAWLFVQPLLTLIVYVVVFGQILKINTNQLPPVLFYYSGIILWNFFNESFNASVRTFKDNIHIFSKVYFPRIIIPTASLITHFTRFCIQFLLLIPLIIFFIYQEEFHFTWGRHILLIPVVILAIGLISLSMGLLFSVATAKYRDLGFVVELGTRLLFFITPILYPLSYVREDLRWIVVLNPLTPLFELFRVGLFGVGTVSSGELIYVGVFILLSLSLSLVLFNKYGKKLLDVI